MKIKFFSPATSFKSSFIYAFGVFIAIAACGYIGKIIEQPILIAPFAATSLIIFALPKTPVAQPLNVFGGYLVSTLVAFAAERFLPYEIWSLALSVAVASFLMIKLRVTHPPAAGIHVVMFFMNPAPSFQYLIFPVLAGAIILLVIATVYNKFTNHEPA